MFRVTLVCALLGLFLCSKAVWADVDPEEWAGQWSMNHDGRAATLIILPPKGDYAGPQWKIMTLNYRNAEGQVLQGQIEKIDQQGQHMVFQIDFPKHQQRFDGYIFSWDKKKMAGTTVWNGRTFGFYATK